MKLFSILEGGHTCSFSNCQKPKNDNFVIHAGGEEHPMHLECAIATLKNLCTICNEEVDSKSLIRLQEQVQQDSFNSALGKKYKEDRKKNKGWKYVAPPEVPKQEGIKQQSIDKCVAILCVSVAIGALSYYYG